MANDPEEPPPDHHYEEGALQLEESHPLFEEEGGPVKTFLEHLEDLRWVLIRSGSSLLVAMMACMGGAGYLVGFLKWPLLISGVKINLELMGPMSGLSITMKIALYGGICIALPFILFFIAQFIMPALKANEKKYFQMAFIIGGGLFLLGIMLCYFFILPMVLSGTVQLNKWLGIDSNLWRAEDYFGFVITFMIGVGLSFEVPVVILSLVKLGIIPHEWLTKGRKYFFVINLVLVAVITPDFLSTFFIVFFVQVLMEICIWISAYWERQKRAIGAG
jgi:sec-independent protein translocase protein TatC